MRANGKDLTLDTAITLKKFLLNHDYPISRVVVERNGQIITRDQFATTVLSNDDRLEIVHFVGGG